jgi:hypothetical protein
MDQFRVTGGPIRLPIGAVIAITPEQVLIREHRLEDLEGGTYRVVEPVEFKVGETLGIEYQGLSKALLDQIEPGLGEAVKRQSKSAAADKPKAKSK